MFTWALKKILGTKHQREIKRLGPRVDAINALEPRFKKLSDAELKAKTAEFRQQIENGASLDSFLHEAFAVVREAGVRSLGMRHYDVQLIGGMVLHQGKIAEMRTGEGKTLVSTLPCYLNALPARGVHVVTVNDYLAKRDAEWMGRLHNFLGLTVGVIHPRQPNAEKKQAYAADITYGQNNEFGFDYLRDNMKFSIFDYVQRDLHYAIVDEVDSILIDEARTPLIISGPGETASEKYIKINEVIPKLKRDDHYVLDEKARSVSLTEEGNELAEQLLNQRGLLVVKGSREGAANPYREAPAGNLYDPVNLETLHILQQSLRAHTLYKRDEHYMVSPDGKVLIIDDFTGRVLPGRRWSDGLHQAVEAKERVKIEDENLTLATISFQNLFRLYEKLSGMTGTADTEATEFHNTYKLDVVVIPTNKPVVRADAEDLVYKSEREKFKAVVKEIEDCNKRGQPVLVGTASVKTSDVLSNLLTRANIPHEVLNAKQHEREAYIVAQAGARGAVTVATNMAGRGTDIILGGNAEMLAKLDVLREATEEMRANPEALQRAIEERESAYSANHASEAKAIKELGGLHILGTERHESRRIDNQLRGRAGRQGDPGSSRFYLSLEDDLMRIFAGDRIQTMMDRMGMEEDVPIEHRWVTKAVENAQKRVEERNFDIRKNLLEYDDVMNQQRKSIYSLRRQVLMGQYRTVPTDEQKKKGAKPELMISEMDPKLREVASPIIEDIIKLKGAPPIVQGTPPEEVDALRREALGKKLSELGEIRHRMVEREIYLWFGCRLDLKRFRMKPVEMAEFAKDEVGMSLTEQRERLLDLIDEIVGTMVDHACPESKEREDYDIDGLSKAYKEQFGIEATGLARLDREEIARRLFSDAEAILNKKAQEIGQENYLRLFRNFYLQDIDRQWINHLQAMDHLRQGIGLRGYGQRDPKKEYKREGYNMFVEMIQDVKSSVASNMYKVERVREEDLARIEEQRRKQAEQRQQQMRSSHATADGGGAAAAAGSRAQVAGGSPMAPAAIGRAQRRAAASRARGAPGAAAPNAPAPEPVAQTVKRDRPKVGRNDPCWCGSGKKYKSCHYREDQQNAGLPQ